MYGLFSTGVGSRDSAFEVIKPMFKAVAGILSVPEHWSSSYACASLACRDYLSCLPGSLRATVHFPLQVCFIAEQVREE